MTITGKQCYEAALPHLTRAGFEALPYDKPDDFYEELAANLNKLQPQPTPGPITGKALQDAYTACHPETFGRGPALDWQDVDDNTKALHEAVATKLSETHITPSQGRIEALELELEMAKRAIAIGMVSGQRLEKTIEALQGLVRDYRELQTRLYNELLQNVGRDEGLEDLIDALHTRAMPLLGEEPAHAGKDA